MTILTHQQVFEALRDGAILLTSSHRLNRFLTERFDAECRAAGQRAWCAPAILPWDAWLRVGWKRLAARMFDRGERPPLLLQPDQDALLWERVIAASHAERLLDAAATAAQVRKSWELLHEWKPKITAEEWESTPDGAAFREWMGGYVRELRRNNYTDAVAMPDLLLAAPADAWAEVPGPVMVCGFDELTPRQRNILEAVRAAGGEIREVQIDFGTGSTAEVRVVALQDAQAELREAAEWALELLRRGEPGSIGVAVPGLNSGQRARIERVFTEVLHPDTLGDPEAPRLFNISAGTPLAQAPLVYAALVSLRMLHDPLPLEAVSTVLLSPFTGDFERDGDARAGIDARIRRSGALQIPFDALRVAAGGCARFKEALDRFAGLRAQMPGAAHAPEWARLFSEALQALGWPGERARNSTEYQTLTHWANLLDRFARLDWVAGPMGSAEALARLGKLAEDATFQPKSGDAPVQVLGLLETSGLSFRHLWVLGLDDEVWPAPPRPDPFLPLSAQRRHGMPSATAERELAFAQRLTGRVQKQADHVTFSYPQADGDRALRASRLLPREGEAGEMVQRSWWAAPVRDGAPALEAMADALAPALPAGPCYGGSGLLKRFSACPFQAFVRYRLQAEALNDCSLGLNALDRGNLVHGVLAAIWTELKNSAGLRAEDPGPLIRSAVEGELARLEQKSGLLSPVMKDLEQQRLERLMREWLNLEAQRGDFEVTATETERTVTLAGLQIKLRIDRVDRLPDGSEVLLDYKTGEVKAKAWEGERPDEPQLPVYAATHEGALAGVAFASVRTGETEFAGTAARADVLPGVKAAYDFAAQVREWRTTVTALAEAYRSGYAAVDPKDPRETCQYCEYKPICRIQEGTVADE